MSDVNLTHKRVEKTWGEEVWVVNREYCGKILRINPGKKCSLHYHKIKDETFYLQSGLLVVTYYPAAEVFLHLRGGGTPETVTRNVEARVVVMRPTQSLHVPPFTVHQFEAANASVLLEFSTTHADADSYRLAPGSPA